jgi:hypothetical protein
VLRELQGPAERPVPPTQKDGQHGRAIQPRVVVGLVLIVAGCVWAAFRSLSFFGVTPLHLGYDLDQPPLLLVLVGIWLVYRSRRR